MKTVKDMNTQNNIEIITEKPTVIKRGFDGWVAKTVRSVNGQAFQITSSKNSRGVLKTDAMPIKMIKSEGMVSTQFDSDAIFNKTLELASEKVSRVNETAITKQHYYALTVFEEKVKAGEIQPEEKQVPVIGSILFLDGYGKTKGSDGNYHIVYEIENTRFGTNYHTVEATTLALNTKDYVKPYSEKFGIGTYFEPDFVFTGSENDLNNLVIEAKQLAAKNAEYNKQVAAANAEIRAKKIAEGKKLVNIPSWAKTLIVADHYQDNSDSQSDYFAASTTETFYLAYSKTTRNNMNELKKASKAFEETENFVSLLENPEEGKDLIEEYTEGHHLLPNYFLGTSRWFGWKVNKRKYFDLTDEKIREKLYIAAVEGRYLCENKKASEKLEKSNISIEIIDYSEKAFALTGDTKEIKEDLKILRGRFNPRLKCGAGWIFPKTKLDEVKELLAKV